MIIYMRPLITDADVAKPKNPETPAPINARALKDLLLMEPEPSFFVIIDDIDEGFCRKHIRTH